MTVWWYMSATRILYVKEFITIEVFTKQAFMKKLYANIATFLYFRLFDYTTYWSIQSVFGFVCAWKHRLQTKPVPRYVTFFFSTQVHCADLLFKVHLATKKKKKKTKNGTLAVIYRQTYYDTLEGGELIDCV